jgi:hypothetical protein
LKLKHVVVGAVLLVVVGQCRDDSDVVAGAQARDSAQRSDSARRSAPSDSAAARNRREAEASSEASQPSRSAAPSGEHDGDKQTAAAALDVLQVKGRAPMTGYDRDRFGQAWLDADRNGCDTRNDVLGEYLREVTLEGNGCVVSAGSYDDPYTGSKIDYWQGHGALLDIDHVVSLGNAWATGAFGWPIRQRAAFANDPLNLLPADAGANRQKGDGDAATWLPPNASYRCQYVSRQVAVKAKYDLWVTAPEKAAIQRVLAACDGQTLTRDGWGAPTEVDHNISDPMDGENDQAATDSSAVPATDPSTSGGSVHYDSCDAARAAGATPVRIGDPGYGTHLDRDGDGTGCE